MRILVILLAAVAMVVVAGAVNAQDPVEVSSSGGPVFETLESTNAPLPVIVDDYGDSQAGGACEVSGCDGNTACDACGCCQGPLSAWDRCKCRHQAKWWGYPEEFNELPLGASANSILRLQVARAEEARLTLYDYDFIDGSPSLKPRGRTRVMELADFARRSGGTIKIEPIRSELDSQRLFAIKAMATESLGLHPDQIVIASPIAAGLGGEEAVIIRENHLEHVRQYGVRRFNFGSFSPQSGGAGGGRSR